MTKTGAAVQSVRRAQRNLTQIAESHAPRAVHRFRTNARRLEAVLAVLPARERHPKLHRTLKKLRQRAGKVRDLDVDLAIVSKLDLGLEVPGQRELMLSLEQHRKRQNRKLAHAARSGATGQLLRRLDRLRQHWQCAPPPLPEAPAAEAARRFLTLHRRQKALDESGLHAFRKRAKLLRYLVELDDQPAARDLEAGLHHLQNLIGDWHDWAALGAWVQRHEATPAGSALSAAVNDMAAAKLRCVLPEIETQRKQLAQMCASLRTPPAGRPATPKRRPPASVRDGHASALTA